MNLLANLFGRIWKMRKRDRRYSFADPYSPSLSYFFKYVAGTDERQGRLFSEYITYPDLKKYITMNRDKDGDLLSLEVKEEDKKHYDQAKLDIHK